MTTTRNQPNVGTYTMHGSCVCSSLCIQVWNQINKEVNCNHLHMYHIYIHHFSSTQGMVNLPAWVTIRLNVGHYPILKGRRVQTIILAGAWLVLINHVQSTNFGVPFRSPLTHPWFKFSSPHPYEYTIPWDPSMVYLCYHTYQLIIHVGKYR